MALQRPSRYLTTATLFVTCLGVMAAPAAAHATAHLASSGCGQAWSGGQDVHGTLPFDGMQRTYLLHIPSDYNPSTPTPLVLNLHAEGMNGTREAQLTHMSAAADAANMLAVYPDGTYGTTTVRGWDAYPAGSPGWLLSPWRGVDDVGFLNALVGSLESQLCVDTARIDVTGYSFGALMAYRLACTSAPWLAAIAPVAGVITQSQASCTLAHAMPLITFMGMKDFIVPYQGFGSTPPVPEQVAFWAGAVGCSSIGQPGFAQGDVVEAVYKPCLSSADVDLYSVTDGGHTWPGGLPLPPLGHTTNVIDATSLMLAFFQAHPLP